MELSLKKMMQKKGKPPKKSQLTTPLVEWLDRLRGRTSELQFEKDLGLARNSIRNMREGRLPGAEKLVRIKQGTGISWEELGTLIEAPFLEKSLERSPESRSQSQIVEVSTAFESRDLLVKLIRDVETIKSHVLGTSIPMTIEKSNLPSELTKDTFTEMVAECVEEKTDKEIKKRFNLLGMEAELDWETFQAIATGEDYPRSTRQFELVKAIVDYEEPEKYLIGEWWHAFVHFAAFNPKVTTPILWD